MRRFAFTGRRGNIPPTASDAAKKTSHGGRRVGASSKDEAPEEATVGTVRERGGRPGPHPKPRLRPFGGLHVVRPTGLVRYPERNGGKTEGVLVADSLVEIKFLPPPPPPGPRRRGVRSRRRRNEARRVRRRSGEEDSKLEWGTKEQFFFVSSLDLSGILCRLLQSKICDQIQHSFLVS